jgi:hypothetical protein
MVSLCKQRNVEIHIHEQHDSVWSHKTRKKAGDLYERLFETGLEEAAAAGSAGPVENVEDGVAGLAGVLQQVQSHQGAAVDPHVLRRFHLLQPISEKLSAFKSNF